VKADLHSTKKKKLFRNCQFFSDLLAYTMSVS